jgi:hypothetical protein
MGSTPRAEAISAKKRTEIAQKAAVARWMNKENRDIFIDDYSI